MKNYRIKTQKNTENLLRTTYFCMKQLKADQFEKRRVEQAKKAAELAEMEAATRAKIAAQKRESTQDRLSATKLIFEIFSI